MSQAMFSDHEWEQIADLAIRVLARKQKEVTLRDVRRIRDGSEDIAIITKTYWPSIG